MQIKWSSSLSLNSSDGKVRVPRSNRPGFNSRLCPFLTDKPTLVKFKVRCCHCWISLENAMDIVDLRLYTKQCRLTNSNGFLKFSGIIKIGWSYPSTFRHLILLMLRDPEPKLVLISLPTLKWHVLKVEGLEFSSISLHIKGKKSMLQLPRTAISKILEISPPTLIQGLLISIRMNDLKLVDMINLLLWFLTKKSHSDICLSNGVYRNMNKGVYQPWRLFGLIAQGVYFAERHKM